MTSVNATRKVSQDTDDSADKEKKADSSPARSKDGVPAEGTSGFTLEMLRAEIEADLAAGGHETAYDSKLTHT